MRDGKAEGAVLVSQSTYRILSSLYAFRLETGKIFMLSLLAAAIVSLILAVTISRPLSRLREEAESAISARGAAREPKAFHLTGRNDEIDRLSASLTSLVGNLARQVSLSENFASDAAHELKNRISGIRNAAELIPGASESELERVAALIAENSCRMERVVASLRELSRIEADSESGETDRAEEVVDGVVRAARDRYPRVRFTLRADAHFPALPLSAERLEIAIENLVENAASFSPKGGTVAVELTRTKDRALVTVRDEGPGIPAEHLGRVFDRFFSWRPPRAPIRTAETVDTETKEAARVEGGEDPDAHHAGVGLSLVEAITRKAGGESLCANGAEGGAIFTLDFPT
jgi:two-component system sensor histidine kinase ChvG